MDCHRVEMELDSSSLEQRHGSGWSDLPSDVFERIVSYLHPNEVACTFRLINKAAAYHFGDQREVLLSEPSPEHAFIWRWGRTADVLHLPLGQRHELLCLTAYSGVLANLEVAFVAVSCPLVSRVFEAAAKSGHLAICEWLADKKCPLGLEAVEIAAKYGHLDLVRWLLRKASSFHLSGELAEAAWEAAGGAGQRAVCEGLLADGHPIYNNAVFAAAYRGHPSLAEWLLQLPQLRLSLEREGELLCAAAHGLDLTALQELYDSRLGSRANGYPSTALERAVSSALHSPTPDWRAKVEWLESKGVRRNPLHIVWPDLFAHQDAVERLEMLRQQCPLPSLGAGFIRDASRFASVAMLKYLRGAGGMRFVLDAAFVQAAEQGDMENLEGLVDLGCTASEDAVLAAAKVGNLRVLQWLLEARLEAGGERVLQGAMSPWLTRAAALSGSLELVQWLRERGCPWNEFAFWSAAESGNLELLEWLHRKGCPMGDSGEAYLRAGRNGDLATLRCLRRLGCPWDPAGYTFSSAVCDMWVDGSKGCSLKALRWLLAQGCPVDWQEAKTRAEQRKDGEAGEVLAWVTRKGVKEDAKGGEDEDEVGFWAEQQRV